MTKRLAQIDTESRADFHAARVMLADCQHVEAACYAAVAVHFPHLSLRDVIAPPEGWHDATLARQVALHLMVQRFALPRRYLARSLCVTRWLIAYSQWRVDARLDEEAFASWYGSVSALAVRLIDEAE